MATNKKQILRYELLNNLRITKTIMTAVLRKIYSPEQLVGQAFLSAQSEVIDRNYIFYEYFGFSEGRNYINRPAE
jgi:hypothetical protein